MVPAFMQTSDNIKTGIDRLASDAKVREALLQEKRVSALKFHTEVKKNLSDFFQQEQAETERAKQERSRIAKEDFTAKYTELKKAIEDRKDFTHSAWDSSVWSSFDIQGERPAHTLTRLGTFTVKTENGSLQIPATFPVLGGKNILLRAEGT